MNQTQLSLIKSIGIALIGIVVLFPVFFKTFETEPGWVSILIDKPYLFGKGGVQQDVIQPGRIWVWRSTDRYELRSTPFKVEEPFDDLTTSNNNFIDFGSTLTLKFTDYVALATKFGAVESQWYVANLQKQYQTIVREETKKYTMEAILSQTGTLKKMEDEIRKQVDQLIIETQLPVKLVDLSLGRAKPNAPVVAEMDKTAAQQQRRKTESEGAEAEKSRESREIARAVADSAYRNKLQLSSEQFIKLEVAKAYAEACKQSKASCYIIDTSNPVVIGAK